MQYKPRASSSRDYLALSWISKCLKRGVEKGGSFEPPLDPPLCSGLCIVIVVSVDINNFVIIMHVLMCQLLLLRSGVTSHSLLKNLCWVLAYRREGLP